MNSGVDKVREWIRSQGLDWKIHIFEEPARTVEEAARLLGVGRESVLKTLVLVDGGKTYAVVLRGDTRLDWGKLRRVVGGSPRLAGRREVLERTGYRAGGVPPVALPQGVEVLVDRRVLELRVAYAGGGDPEALLELEPLRLVDAVGARVVDVAV